jgi:hypothetical protein
MRVRAQLGPVRVRHRNARTAKIATGGRAFDHGEKRKFMRAKEITKVRKEG